jgi:hypothetical protein
MKKSVNELYEMAQNRIIDEFIFESSKEEILDALGRIFYHELLGSCMNTMESVLEEYGLSNELLYSKVTEDEVSTALDDNVFVCDNCGWWYEAGEKNILFDNGFCSDCSDEQENEGEE